MLDLCEKVPMQNMIVNIDVCSLLFLIPWSHKDNNSIYFLQITFMFPHLLHKQNKNFSEDLDKVNEKVKGVGDEVLVSHPCLPDDQLGVEHDEAAEDRQAEPDVSLSHGMAFRELFLTQH